jgi:hypothetical protein
MGEYKISLGKIGQGISMKRLRFIFVIACLSLNLALSPNAIAQGVDPNSDLGQFQTLRTEGMSALERGEREKALRAFGMARQILPDSAQILLLSAKTELELKRKSLARANLLDYLKRGLVVDLNRYPEFTTIWDDQLDLLQAENQSPKGEFKPIAEIPELMLIESLAVNEDNTLLASSLRIGQIGQVNTDGLVKIAQFNKGVSANAIALKSGYLWATTAQASQTQGYDFKTQITSKLIKIDLDDSSIAAQFTDDRKDRRLTDLLLGRDDLYVSDTDTGEVLRLTGYKGKLEVLIPEGYLGSPQGLVENKDANILIVADYSSGLYRVDLNKGSLSRLTAPVSGALLGLDGLYAYGHDIIAVQNGIKPNRILRLKMNEDWTQVKAVEVLLRGIEALMEPTGGQVVGDKFVFVARSQWSEFDDKGRPKSDTPRSALIGEIKLSPPNPQSLKTP